MKLFILSLSLIAFVLTACNIQNTIVPSEEIVKFEVPIDEIDAIDASGIYKIAIRVGDEEKLMIRCNENLKEYLDISDNGHTILFKMGNVNATSDLFLEAYLTVKDLDRIDCSGAVKVMLQNANYKNIDCDLSGVSSIKSKGLIVKTLSVYCSGASLFEVAELEADKITLESSGASNFELAGEVDELKADLSGASHLKGKSLTVNEKADIHASGASGIKFKALGTIVANLSGASRLTYSGSPTNVSKNVSGASTVSVE